MQLMLYGSLLKKSAAKPPLCIINDLRILLEKLTLKMVHAQNSKKRGIQDETKK